VKEEIKEVKEAAEIVKSENDLNKSDQSPKKGDLCKSEDKDSKMDVDKFVVKKEGKSKEDKEVNGDSHLHVSPVKSEHSPSKSGEKSPQKSSEVTSSKAGENSSVKEREGTPVKMEVEDVSVKKETRDSPVKKEVDNSSEKMEDEGVVKKEEEEAIVKKELAELVQENEPQDLTSVKEKVRGDKCDQIVKEEGRHKNVDDTEQKIKDIVKDIKRQTTEEMAKFDRKREKDTKCSFEEEVWFCKVARLIRRFVMQSKSTYTVNYTFCGISMYKYRILLFFQLQFTIILFLKKKKKKIGGMKFGGMLTHV
jgi:hypothetical protein